MEATKELVGELLLRPKNAPTKTFTFEELVPVPKQVQVHELAKY
jgi:hypothetical protein